MGTPLAEVEIDVRLDANSTGKAGRRLSMALECGVMVRRLIGWF